MSSTEKIAGDFVTSIKQQLLTELRDLLLPEMTRNLEQITLDSKETAAYLGIHEDTVRDLCRKKQIPFFKVGGKYLFRQKKLNEWMEQQETQNYKPAQ